MGSNGSSTAGSYLRMLPPALSLWRRGPAPQQQAPQQQALLSWLWRVHAQDAHSRRGCVAVFLAGARLSSRRSRGRESSCPFCRAHARSHPCGSHSTAHDTSGCQSAEHVDLSLALHDGAVRSSTVGSLKAPHEQAAGAGLPHRAKPPARALYSQLSPCQSSLLRRVEGA